MVSYRSIKNAKGLRFCGYRLQLICGEHKFEMCFFYRYKDVIWPLVSLLALVKHYASDRCRLR